MDLDVYQEQAWRTAAYENRGVSHWMGLAYAALGAAGEAGEIANKVKKVNRDDNMELTAERRNSIIDEVGDCLWYLAALCTEINIPFSVVAERNLSSLADREARQMIWGEGDKR